MIAEQCKCGFTELEDETLTDHLQLAFESADQTGSDGLVHEERDRLSCLCGFAAISSDDLDQHFLAVFTPAYAVGQDGTKPEPARDRDEG